MKKIVLSLFLFLGASVALAGPSRIEDLRGWSTNGGFVISWTAPTPAEGTTLTNVTVKYSTSPINALNWGSGANSTIAWLTDPGTPGTEQQAVVTELTADTTYFVAIRTTDSTGSQSTISTLAVVRSGNTTCDVRLAWNPNSEANIAGYRLYIGTAPGVYDTATIDIDDVTHYTVRGQLVYGVVYYFALTAYDTDGLESAKSDEIRYSCR